MRIVDCVQGSEAWHDLRKGRPTASQFVKIITPAKLQPSAQMKDYAAELACVQLGLDDSPEPMVSYWMERGIELEPEAVAAYEEAIGVPTEEVGFVFPDDSSLYGCSPDRLLPENGILEVKCPAPTTLTKYLEEGCPNNYKMQIQAQLWITGADYCDFWAWHPLFYRACHETHEPDERFFAAFEEQIPKFLALVAHYKKILKGMM